MQNMATHHYNISIAVSQAGFTTILSLFCQSERIMIQWDHFWPMIVLTQKRPGPLLKGRTFSPITSFHKSEKTSSENPWDLATSWIIFYCRWCCTCQPASRRGQTSWLLVWFGWCEAPHSNQWDHRAVLPPPPCMNDWYMTRLGWWAARPHPNRFWQSNNIPLNSGTHSSYLTHFQAWGRSCLVAKEWVSNSW